MEVAIVDKLFKVSELSETLNIAEATVWRWIADGKFPKPTKLGRASRWRQSVIEQWLEDQEAKADADLAHSAAENGHSA